MWYTFHKYYGEFLQLIPIALLIWYAIKGGTPLQRIAPILLDVAIVLGLLVYFVDRIPVSIWHPICMLIAAGLAHSVARNTNRTVVLSTWGGVLALIVTGILIAKGTLAL